MCVAAHFAKVERLTSYWCLTDLSQTLREEERTAWQRLLRVLGHELNNSLAPIKSVAGSLAALMGREPKPADWSDDMQRGLAVISSRADSLARFVESYSKLARFLHLVSSL